MSYKKKFHNWDSRNVSIFIFFFLAFWILICSGHRSFQSILVKRTFEIFYHQLYNMDFFGLLLNKFALCFKVPICFERGSTVLTCWSNIFIYCFSIYNVYQEPLETLPEESDLTAVLSLLSTDVRSQLSLQYHPGGENLGVHRAYDQ